MNFQRLVLIYIKSTSRDEISLWLSHLGHFYIIYHMYVGTAIMHYWTICIQCILTHELLLEGYVTLNIYRICNIDGICTDILYLTQLLKLKRPM